MTSGSSVKRMQAGEARSKMRPHTDRLREHTQGDPSGSSPALEGACAAAASYPPPRPLTWPADRRPILAALAAAARRRGETDGR